MYQSGWIKSFKLKKPVDQNGNPIPWLSLPIVDFLGERLKSDMDVFEYGAGNSTLYFAPKVNSVDSVEHEAAWVNILKPSLPSNATIFHESLDNGKAYAEKSTTTGKKYDIILIDGRDRVACCKACLQARKSNGIILYDDSQRDRYQEGVRLLMQQGCKRLDFWGMGSAGIHKKCTTLFYFDDNCLGI